MRAAADRLPIVTIVLLFVGYACTYFHRADLATLAPLWLDDGAHDGLGRALPDIASLGMLVYGFGKFAGGVLADRFGGRKLLVIALTGASLAEFAAAACTQPGTLAVCRVLGMASLALAWPSVGQVVATATPRARLATAMAFLSQSYLLGDATVRAVLAAVVAHGGGPPAVLRTSATALALAALVLGIGFVLVRHSTSRRGAAAAPAAQHIAAAAARTPRAPLAWLAAMSVALALVREALSFWSPLLLVESCAMPAAEAVRASALLPLAGGLGALAAGLLADRGPRWLAGLTLVPLLAGGLGLGLLGAAQWNLAGTLLLLAAVCCCTAMPQSLVSGVLPLRAGTSAGAARLGFVDGMGTLGSVFAAGGIARVRDATSMAVALAALAAVLALAAIAASGFLVAAHRTARASAAPPA
ncbi:MAG TPA: MFS transporter [Planctomycetota bacterium]|nr:MFS transporter [Planctomycetota bacterium]